MFERVETGRLVLRKPERNDVQAIFTRYANDVEVTRLLAWPRHTSLRATTAFLDFSDAQWSRWPVGPYLIESRQGKHVLGGTGLAFESAECAATGYVIAKDSWGKGYATEALKTVVEIARKTGIRRLCALCHPENIASEHVLRKCGFEFEGVLPMHSAFPNLDPDTLCDVLSYAMSFNLNE
jgi:ribosomal-protein-alanine N-acetyltransferase